MNRERCGVLAAAVILVVAMGAGAQNAAPAAKDATAAKASGNVMAVVDGVELSMADLNEILVFSYGLPMAQQLIANELVRQEAVRNHVVVGPDDIKAEHERTLPLLFPMLPEGDREGAFAMYMQEGRVTQKQWDMTMERNAVLRKLAQGRAKVTDEALEFAFGIKYGRQVVVRHIQTAALADAEAVLKEIEGGAAFEKLVATKSVSPSRDQGGLVGPLSAQASPMPPSLTEAALRLKKIGQVSNVLQAGMTFHILKLEKIIEPEKVKFEDVKDALRKELFEQMVQQQQMKILEDLIAQAERDKKIKYVHPILAEQDRQNKEAANKPK
ncbi:MAG: peptidylprolyl isomerase [Phycisphaerae bacterium]|nr:peptidylprolyl isomerase [Phycisphaerae bacterium]